METHDSKCQNIFAFVTWFLKLKMWPLVDRANPKHNKLNSEHVRNDLFSNPADKKTT